LIRHKHSSSVDNTAMADNSLPRIVPLIDQRATALTIPSATSGNHSLVPNGRLSDTRGRPLRDLRISVTDRCNFRCSYCMPKDVFTKDYPYLPHASLLTFEEITRIARQFVAHGVQKIRLTGGEPLLRKNIEILIAQLATLRTPDGAALDLTLTTNGALLARKAEALKAAGLNRLTVSLDGLDDAVFRAMNDVDFPVQEVLDGIAAARAAGMGPIKVNMVVKRGTNDHQILPMARHFKGTGIVLRFIEYMDVGATNGWRMNDVLPSAEVVQRLQQELSLIPLEAAQPGETAQRWGYADAMGKHDKQAGEIGVISSVTQAFCADCNRARLSTEGQLYLCLFASQGYNLRELVRGEHTDAALASAIAHIWGARADRYSELRGSEGAAPLGDGKRRVEMSYIGG
jgi:cyclic pyranopterin phosphate synthase